MIVVTTNLTCDIFVVTCSDTSVSIFKEPDSD